MNKEDCNILYVDDEKRSLSSFKNLYRRKFIIHTASTGEEGLDLLATHPIHVVITDQRMPGMQGTDFLRKVKAGWPDIKYIILTAYSDNEVLKEAVNELGIFWYMNKPFDPDQMEQVIVNANNSYWAEKKLKESEAKFRGVFNSMSDVFIRSDMDGKCLIVSPSIYSMLGYKPEELIGKDLADFYANPNERTRIIDKLEKTKSVNNFEIDFLRKDGERITVSSNAKIYYDSNGDPLGTEGNIRDITAQKKAESEHNKLFNYSFDLLAIAGMDGYFKELNPAWEKVTGYSLEDLKSKPFTEFINKDDLDNTTQELKKLEAGKVTASFENRYIRKNGEPVYLSWTATPVPEEQISYCIARDISARKQAEEELLNYQSRLKAMANELIVAEEKQRRQIAANLHDDVGQILASLRLQIAGINESINKSVIIEKLKSISSNLHVAIDSVRTAIFELSPPQLNEIGLVSALSDWMEKELDAKHGIQYELETDKKKYLLNNEVQYLIYRSARELLFNVIKHSRAGKVEVRIEEQDEIISITVRDDGRGFNYTPELLRMKGAGFGLLSISERVESLGGELIIDTDLGRGTNVSLKVPVEN